MNSLEISLIPLAKGLSYQFLIIPSKSPVSATMVENFFNCSRVEILARFTSTASAIVLQGSVRQQEIPHRFPGKL